MHEHNDNNFSMMMWMMAICCLGPLIIIFFAGKATGGLSIWLIVGALVLCVGAHLFMHRKSKHSEVQAAEAKNKPDDKNPQT